jgi:hypothetical protein
VGFDFLTAIPTKAKGFGMALTGADKKSYFLNRLRYAAVINRLNSQAPVTR